MLSSIRKMYEIYYFMKKITLIIMEGAQFDQSTVVLRTPSEECIIKFIYHRTDCNTGIIEEEKEQIYIYI